MTLLIAAAVVMTMTNIDDKECGAYRVVKIEEAWERTEAIVIA
jgi:hypothetical protein